MTLRDNSPWDGCALKQYIRRIWLDASKERSERLAKFNRDNKLPGRGVRYLTFCGASASDVLFLQAHGLFRAKNAKSKNDNSFKGVFIIDKSSLIVDELKLKLDGLEGIAYNFEKLMLTDDIDEQLLLDPSYNPLLESVDEPDTSQVRERQRFLTERRRFFMSFPYDVLNLDLCGYLFNNSEDIPGDILRATHKIFQLQKKRLESQPGEIPGFTLMLTTKVGPQDLSSDYLIALEECLESNIKDHPDLSEPFNRRSGGLSVAELRDRDFDTFFKLTAPKIIAKQLLELDWCVDKRPGIKVYQFDRPTSDPNVSYRMLHYVLQVTRQYPGEGARFPGPTQSAREDYKSVVADIFATGPTILGPDFPSETQAVIDRDYELITARSSLISTQ